MTSEEWLAEYLEQGSSGQPRTGAGPGPAGGPPPTAQRLLGRLAEPDTWAEPPEGLLDRILADVEDEREALAGGGPEPGRAHGADPRGRRTRLRRVVGVGVAATALVVAAVTGVVVARRPATTHLALSGTRLAPAAHATADVRPTPSGLAITLDVRDLPPSTSEFYYQAWMKGPDGLVTIGTFHMRGGPGKVELWSAVSLADYPTITVTREPTDRNPASSGQVVLTTAP